MQKKALIYCRVSDTKQKIDGHGLESQEHRCRQFAEQNGLIVERVFHDDVSGGGNFNKRPAMTKLLDHLKRHKAENHIVIFDDIKRFSRDVYFYWDLIRKLDAYNAVPMSPNFRFEQTPEGRFQQSITVAAGEYERETIARQTKQKTKARLEAGYHAFIAPVGFKYIKCKTQGKILVRDEPTATIIAEMMEGFANGRFQSKRECKYFLENAPEFPKGKSGRIGNNQADAILGNPLYAGMIEYKPWGVTLRKGKHEGMVSYEIFCKIQDRLQGRKNAPARKDLNKDFILRGAVACECGNALTAAWSKSKSGKRYPYYVCQNRNCDYKGKSIRRDVLEGEFEKLLQYITPSKGIMKAAEQMFKDLWSHQGKAQEKRKTAYINEVAKIDRNIEQTLDRMVDAHNPTVIRAFEQRIEKLEQEKLILEEKAAHSGQSYKPFEEMYRTSLHFLASPYKYWVHGQFALKRAVLKLLLPQPLIWDRKGVYRTPDGSSS